MRNTLLLIKITERLNKLSSSDFDNIENWQIAEAFNKAQLSWVRRQIEGINARKQGDEGSSTLIDDLEPLLETAVPLTPITPSPVAQAQVYNQPDNLLAFKSVSVEGTTECCPPQSLIVYLTTVSAEQILLRDPLHAPSFFWGETFCTRADGKIRIFHGPEMGLQNALINYYRLPRPISFPGYTDPATGAASTNVTCEFKDDIAELLVDECVSILAADLENTLQVGIVGPRAQAQA